VQRAIVAVCDAAARAAGLRRDTWDRQGNGDGELAVLPPDEAEELVVDRYVRELDAELGRYNGRHVVEARLRLRVAVHFGRLSRASIGHAGPAPIAVARLIDSEILRTALAQAPEANLALLVSASVFDDTIASLATTLRPADFRRVAVAEKEFVEDAWLWVPGQGSHSAGTTVGGVPPTDPIGPTGSQQVVHSTFKDQVNAPGSVFGFSIGGDR
jgi:hypothetical protein